jgi:hypothetical protein
MKKSEDPHGDKSYRNRYSIDLHKFDKAIAQLAKKEDRGKANMVKQLIREALTARGVNADEE